MPERPSKPTFWQYLLGARNHTSDFFCWEWVSRGHYRALGEQVVLLRGNFPHKPSGWYLHVDLGQGCVTRFAGFTRKEAFLYADNWAYERMAFFLDHGHV